MGTRHVLTAIALASSPVHANPVEVFGLTSRHAAQANAGVASVDDAAALYYDPAGLVADPKLEFEAGTVTAVSHLKIENHYASLTDPIGFQIAMRAPLPLAGALADRIVVGLALHLLPTDVAHVVAPPPDQPFYPYYGDRLSRIVVLPGAAIRLDHGVSLGIAINVLAGLGGTISASEGATRAIDSRVDERVPTIARVIAGAQYQLAPAWKLGAVYRQRFEIPFSTSAVTDVAGEPIDLDLAASGAFTPDTIVAGGAWTDANLTASLDLGWANWSAYPGPYVRVNSELPLVGAVPGQTPVVPFKDTFAIRGGVEVTRGIWVLRGGYGFESSAIPKSQPGVTNLLDGPHHTFGAGAGWRHGTMRIDAHVELQVVGGRTITKTIYDGTGTYDPFSSVRDEDTQTPGTQTSNPGFPGLHSGGEVLSAGITFEVSK